MTTLNQYLHIFSKVFLIVPTMPRPTPMGIRHEVFALAREGIKQGAIAARVGLTPHTQKAYSKGMLPLDLWCQASLQGLPERQHLSKTVHCWGWSDRIVSWVLGPWRRRWEICMEWGLVAQQLTTDSCPVVTGHIDPQRSPADCQPPSSRLGVGAEVAEPDSGSLAACHLRWWVKIPTLPGNWQA